MVILHEAGWDTHPPQPPVLTEQTLQNMRHAYSDLLREDHVAILQQTLGNGQRVEDAGRALGISPEASRSLFSEALARLVGFAEVAERQGFVPMET